MTSLIEELEKICIKLKPKTEPIRAIKEHSDICEFEEDKRKIIENLIGHSPLAEDSSPFRIEPCNNGKLCLKAHYYVGCWWLKRGEIFVEVLPKRDLNIPAILEEIFEDKEIREKIENAFKFSMDEPLIEVESSISNFLFFAILSFIHMVEKLVQRGIKKGYVEVEENLRNRIKGKVLVSRTVVKNSLKGYDNRVFCRYSLFIPDCLENRIIKFTLLFIKKYFLYNFGFSKNIGRRISYLLSAFETVKEVKISDRDFLRVKNSIFYRDYDKAIKLAKAILRHKGFYRNIGSKEKTYITPFCIDMPRLFELWVWKKLKDELGKDYKIHYQYQVSVESVNKEQKPDFVIENSSKSSIIIADAKYKFNKIEFSDISQISTYGRLERLRKGTQEPLLILIYPLEKENDTKSDSNGCEQELPFKNKKSKLFKCVKLKDFANFCICYVKLPLSSSNSFKKPVENGEGYRDTM